MTAGGKRQGAGRPKKEPTRNLTFRVPVSKATDWRIKINKYIFEVLKATTIIILLLFITGCNKPEPTKPKAEPIKPPVTIDSSKAFNIIGRWATSYYVIWKPFPQPDIYEFKEDLTGNHNTWFFNYRYPDWTGKLPIKYEDMPYQTHWIWGINYYHLVLFPYTSGQNGVSYYRIQ